MAGDWIKMRVDLQSHPKVVRILSATQSDKFRAIGGLHAVWGVFDKHSGDGRLSGYTPETLDHIIGWPGFAEAMIKVGWLAFDGAETLSLPEFDEHNSASGKRRAEDQKRKKGEREAAKNSQKSAGQILDKVRTESGLEKRREDIKEPPISPKGETSARQKSPTMTLQTFLDACSAKGERPIREYQSLWDYAEQAGLPQDFVALAWVEFCRRFMASGTGATKKYSDWRRAFRKYVENNYLKLWAIDPKGEYFLTAQGKQAQKVHEAKGAA